jgi:hypothetical protein
MTLPIASLLDLAGGTLEGTDALYQVRPVAGSSMTRTTEFRHDDVVEVIEKGKIRGAATGRVRQAVTQPI